LKTRSIPAGSERRDEPKLDKNVEYYRKYNLRTQLTIGCREAADPRVSTVGTRAGLARLFLQ
jgi:hypothetical protein